MVPFTMPVTRLMRSPASDSRAGGSAGCHRRRRPRRGCRRPSRCAASNTSRPCVATSSLLAVTTGLPAASVCGDQRAGGLDAAHDLDHDVDVGVVHDRGRVGGEGGGRQRQPAVRVRGRGRPPWPPRCARRRAPATRRRCRGSAAQVRHRRCRTPGSRPVPARPALEPSRQSPSWRSPPTPSRRASRRPGRRRSRAAPPPEPGPRGRTRLRGAASGCRWKPSSGRRRR